MSEENRKDDASVPHKSGLWAWFDRRTGLNDLLRKSLDEPIPGGARLAYIFGSGLLFIFVSQIITGICLAVYYVPSAETAHVSVAYMVKEVASGAFLRSLHSYGSSAMIVVLVLHFLQTFLYGSYKGKRELLWISGGVLSLLILGMAFTGYLLAWDQKAYFATSVGTNIAGQVPLIGEWIRRLLRGGAAMGTLTISRFYVLHVFVIPAAIFLFVAVHIFMFRKAGAAGPINEDPVRPRLRTELFYPKQVLMDMAFALVLIAVLGILAHFRPVELGPVANPNDSHYLPRPEWYYLPMFQWLKYWEGPRTVIGIVIIPAILLVLFFLLPFLDRGPERRPWRRPIPVGAVLIVLLGAIWLGVMSRVGDARDPSVAAQLAQQQKEEDQFFHAPFEPYLASPHSSMPATVALGGLAAQGKKIFDSHGCSGCHGENAAGGTIGPALTQVGDKFRETELTNLLRHPSSRMLAGGMTPVILSVTDMTALTSYIRGLAVTGPLMAGASAPEQQPMISQAGEATPQVEPEVETAVAGAPSGAHNSDTLSGSDLFQAKACFACHGEAGVGTARAPALTGISTKFSSGQIANLLRNPTARMQAGGMPPLAVNDEDLNSLVGYLKSLKATGKTPPSLLAQTPQSLSGAGASLESPLGQPTSQPQLQATSGKANQPGAGTPANPQIQHGKTLFDTRGCAACHGVGGVGTPSAPGLASAGKRMQSPELANLLQHPTQKMRAGGMPAVNMNKEDMASLTSYIQSLGTPRALSASSAPGGTKVGSAPQITQPPMNKVELQGKSIFETRRCGGCHGDKGVGGTAAAPALAGTGGIFPPELLAQILRHHTARMLAGGMPPVSVSDTELRALVAYIRYISASPVVASSR